MAEIRDPRTEGTSGLTGLNRNQEPVSISTIAGFKPKYSDIAENQFEQSIDRGVTEYYGTPELGESHLDNRITELNQLYDLNETRADLQPWYEQIGSGIVKGGVLAGTTFLDGIVGTIAGGLNVLVNQENITNSDNPLAELGNQFINNPWSVAMQSINEKMEEALPNYYSKEETENPWWENVFTSNFIGDKFLKNLGFTIGAAYSAKLTAGVASKAMGLGDIRNAYKGTVTSASGRVLNSSDEIARAYKTGDAYIDGAKLTRDLANSAKNLKNAEWGLKTLGAVNSAMGEGRIEAIGNSKEWFDYNKQLLDDSYDRELQSIESRLFEEHPEWFSLVRQPEGGAINMITSPIGMRELSNRRNIASDKYNRAIEKITNDRTNMANAVFGMNIGLLSASNLWQYGRFISGGYTSGRQAKNLLTGSVKEGYAANKREANGALIKALTNPLVEAQEEMSQGLISETTGLKYGSELNDFYGAKVNPDAEDSTVSWLDALAKGFSNTYGNVEAWEEGFIGALTGFMGIPNISVKTNNQGKKRPQFSFQGELWEGIKESQGLRKESNALAEELNNYIKNPDFINYYQGTIRHNKYQNDMDNALDTGDNFAFKNAEHSQLVSDAIMFEKAGRIQDLYDMIEEASTINLDDVEEIKSQTIDKATGKSIFEGKTNDQIINHIKKQAEDAKAKVDNYIQISDNLKTLYGENISPDHLEELTWMLTQVSDWETRFKELFNNINTTYESLTGNTNAPIINTESPYTLLNTLNRQEVFDLLDKARNSKSNLKNLQESQIVRDVTDMIKIYQARANFIDRYDALSKNPELFTQQVKKDMDEVINQRSEKILQEATNSISTVKNIQDLKTVIPTIDPSVLTKVFDNVKEGNNEDLKRVIDDFQSIGSANTTLTDILSIMNPSPEVESVKNILMDAVENANTPLDIISSLNTAKDTIESKEIKDTIDNLINEYNKLNNSKKATKKDNNKPKKAAKKKFSLFDAPTEDIPDPEYAEESQDTNINNNKGEETLNNKEVEPKEEVTPYDQIRELVSKETGKKITSKTLPDSRIDALNNMDEVSLKKEITKKEGKIDNAAKIIYSLTNPPVSEIGEGTNSEIEDTYTDNSGPYLRSWVQTKYDFNELKNRNTRREVIRDNPIVKALDELGVYDFVDSGKLGDIINDNPDTTIHYILSNNPTLSNIPLLAIKLPPTVLSVIKRPETSFEIDGDIYQAVGALGYKANDIESSENYNYIINSLNTEKGENNSPYFVSNKFTNKVRHIYSGRMSKSTEDIPPRRKSLKMLLNGEKPHFGIYYSDTKFVTPTLDEYKQIVPINSNNSNPREGSMWLMTKEADGRYYAKGIQVSRFSADEYDLTEHMDTPVVQRILKNLQTIADPTKSTYDRSMSKYDIEEVLYFPDGPKILFNEDTVSIADNNTTIYSNNLSNLEGDITEFSMELLNALQSDELNLRFQIRPADLIDPYYVNNILNSDILSTDLLRVHNVNASFDMYLNNLETGEPVITSEISSKGHTGTTGINPLLNTTTIILNSNSYSLLSDGTITLNDKVIENQNTISEINLINQINRGEILPMNGSNTLFLGYYPDGKEFGIVNNKVKKGKSLDNLKIKANQNVSKQVKKANLNNIDDLFNNSDLWVEESAEEPTEIMNIDFMDESYWEEDIPSNKPELISLTGSNKPTIASLSDKFDPNQTKSIKELQDSGNTITFDKLIRTNRNILKEFNVKSVNEFIELANKKGLDVTTINSQESFNSFIDILKNCR